SSAEAMRAASYSGIGARSKSGARGTTCRATPARSRSARLRASRASSTACGHPPAASACAMSASVGVSAV
ncbi:MAG: hypothetical protein ACK559_31055, partial [bacterium]